MSTAKSTPRRAVQTWRSSESSLPGDHPVGGPSSVSDPGAPTADAKILDLGVPVLGICYGMQLIAQLAGGQVKASNAREYGRATSSSKAPTGCSRVRGAVHRHGLGKSRRPHRAAAAGISDHGTSANAPVAAMQHDSRPLFGVLFHPEVAHTTRGGEIIHNFLSGSAAARPTGRRVTSSTTRSGAFGSSSAQRAVICGLPVAWIRRSRRLSCIGPSATG